MRGSSTLAILLACAGCYDWDSLSANADAPCVASIAIGGAHGCAVLRDASLWCWGQNSSGELGFDPAQLAKTETPLQVMPSGQVAKVAVGSAGHTCAVKLDGSLWCWGRNDYNQLGPLASGAFSFESVQVILDAEILELAAGGNTTCARTTAGIDCWGDNTSNQLGPGLQVGLRSSAQPNRVRSQHLDSNAVEIELGGRHACVRINTGEVYCWGWGFWGQTGPVAAMVGADVPAPVTSALLGANGATLGLGDGHSCAATTEGNAVCWGANLYGQIGPLGQESCNTMPCSTSPVSIAGDAVTSIAGGTRHSCLLGSGGVACWGSNGFGQLGNGRRDVGSPDPTPVVLEDVIEVSAGDDVTCARTSVGRAFCWGRNDLGQLGDGDLANSAVPAEVRLSCD